MIFKITQLIFIANLLRSGLLLDFDGTRQYRQSGTIKLLSHKSYHISRNNLFADLVWRHASLIFLTYFFVSGSKSTTKKSAWTKPNNKLIASAHQRIPFNFSFYFYFFFVLFFQQQNCHRIYKKKSSFKILSLNWLMSLRWVNFIYILTKWEIYSIVDASMSVSVCNTREFFNIFFTIFLWLKWAETIGKLS